MFTTVIEENKNLIEKPTKIKVPHNCCCCSRIRHWPNQRTNPDYKLKNEKIGREEKNWRLKSKRYDDDHSSSCFVTNASIPIRLDTDRP